MQPNVSKINRTSTLYQALHFHVSSVCFKYTGYILNLWTLIYSLHMPQTFGLLLDPSAVSLSLNALVPYTATFHPHVLPHAGCSASRYRLPVSFPRADTTTPRILRRAWLHVHNGEARLADRDGPGARGLQVRERWEEMLALLREGAQEGDVGAALHERRGAQPQ